MRGSATTASAAAREMTDMGLCGRLAAVVFDAVDAASERTGDGFLISIQAVADVVTAPVQSTVTAKRKTHEAG